MAKRQLAWTEIEGGWKLTLAGESRTFLVAELSEEIRKALELHGLKQKLGDAANKGNEAEKQIAIDAVWESLRAGDWTQRGGVSSLLVEALMRLTGADAGTVKGRLDGMTEEEKKTLQARPEVQKAINEIKIERLEKRVDEAAPFTW